MTQFRMWEAFLPFYPVFRIRIQLIRIRIKNKAKNLNPDPDPEDLESESKLFLNAIWQKKIKLLHNYKIFSSKEVN